MEGSTNPYLYMQAGRVLVDHYFTDGLLSTSTVIVKFYCTWHFTGALLPGNKNIATLMRMAISGV